MLPIRAFVDGVYHEARSFADADLTFRGSELG